MSGTNPAQMSRKASAQPRGRGAGGVYLVRPRAGGRLHTR